MVAGRLGVLWNVAIAAALPEFRVTYADRHFKVGPASP
jgi:hypothetical protein